jgi:putative tricarboxylic transport membrane protein
MKNRNLISGVFFLGIGVIISIYAITYGLGGSGSPGPGFLPFLTGIGLVLLSLFLLISTLKDGIIINKQTEKFFPEKDSFKKIILSISALILFGFILEYLGYLLTTLLFMMFMLKFIESRKRMTVFLCSSLTAISFYLLFEKLLKSQLPKGILGM